MSQPRRSSVLQFLRTRLGEGAPSTVSDGELLGRYAEGNDEAAFELLLWRHAAMVYHVCRRVLGEAGAAEDAFQATFLVLARKAHAVRRGEALGGWLYRVAYRLALKARARAAEPPARLEADVSIEDAAPEEAARRELRQLLYEEIDRLPARYRCPVVLCYLQAKTLEEAARELGWKKGTVSGRLARARDLLRRRLLRRGITPGAGLLPALLRVEPIPAGASPLVETTLRAALRFAAGQSTAAGAASARAAVLAKGALDAMFWTRVKVTATVLALVLALGAGTAGLIGQAVRADPAEGAEAAEAGRGVGPGERKPEAPPEEGGALGEKPEDLLQLAYQLARSRENLKQIALALHSYHDMNGVLPAPAIYEKKGGKPAGGLGAPPGTPPGGPGGAGGVGPAPGPGGAGAFPMGIPAVGAEGGKALLSWRVALLPWLGEDDLYKQFRHDEPWDSPHNVKLLAKMPEVFAPPGRKARRPHSTFYQVLVGPHAAFTKHAHARLSTIVDGTSNTILVVEAGAAVPWTKPADLHYARDEPLPELGGLFAGVFHAAFADGSVRSLKKDGDRQLLRWAIEPADGHPIDFEKLTATRAQRLADLVGKGQISLARENAAAKAELARVREEIEVLRAERELLREIARERARLGKAAADPLLKERRDLQDALRKAEEERKHLREEIERAREGLSSGEEPPRVDPLRKELDVLRDRLEAEERRHRQETSRLKEEVERLRSRLEKGGAPPR